MGTKTVKANRTWVPATSVESLRPLNEAGKNLLDGISAHADTSGGPKMAPGRDLGYALPAAIRGALQLVSPQASDLTPEQHRALKHISETLSAIYAACNHSAPNGFAGMRGLFLWAQESSPEISSADRQSMLAMVALLTLQELFVMLFGGRHSNLWAYQTLENCQSWSNMATLLGLLSPELTKQIILEFNALEVHPGDIPLGRLLLRNADISKLVETKLTKEEAHLEKQLAAMPPEVADADPS